MTERGPTRVIRKFAGDRVCCDAHERVAYETKERAAEAACKINANQNRVRMRPVMGRGCGWWHVRGKQTQHERDRMELVGLVYERRRTAMEMPTDEECEAEFRRDRNRAKRERVCKKRAEDYGEMRVITARHAGECLKCREPFIAGARIAWSPWDGATWCASCEPDTKRGAK